MIAYILSPRTGASLPAVSRQLGIKQSTIRGWGSGKTKPSTESQHRIKDLYQRFFGINNKTKPLRSASGAQSAAVSAAKLVIENTSNRDGITIQGRTVNPIDVDRSTRRDWSGVLAATTEAEAVEAFIGGILKPSPLPPVGPGYLEFDDGDYTITTR